MNKYVAIGMICLAIAGCYLVLTVGMPIISGLAGDAASAIPDTYASTKAGLNYASIIMYSMPAVIGIIFIALILKRSKS